jgi:inhibitor of cysteine peptidase
MTGRVVFWTMCSEGVAMRSLWAAVLLGALLGAWIAIPEPSATTTETITVGQAASGSHRRLHRRDLLVVRLPSNPSTGYSWKIRSGTGKVLALTRRTYVPPRDTTRVGAPGTDVFRMRAAARGKTVLRIVYVRPWEPGAPPARTFTLRLTVS